MGKIFGISDLPVSTIESALKGMYHVDPPPGVKVPRVKPKLLLIFHKLRRNQMLL